MDEHALDVVISDLNRNPIGSARILMALAAHDSDELLSVVPLLLRKIAEGPGGRFLLSMLRTKPGYPSALLDPAFATPSEAEKFSALLSVLKLSPDQAPASQASSMAGDGPALRLLRMADHSSDDGGILLSAIFLHHGSPRVRSKAALLAAQTDHRRDWMRFLRSERDARVRANAIEALWHSPNESVLEVFRAFARDPAPRAAANAIVGLHRRNPPANVEEAEALLLEMLGSSDPKFVTSAAWAMGATGDPRYLLSLQSLVRRPGPHLKSALQAMRILRAALPEPAADTEDAAPESNIAIPQPQ